MVHGVVHAIQAHAGAVHVARYNPGGRYLLTGGADQQIQLWNTKSGAPGELDAKGRSPSIQRYSGHTYEVLCLDIASDSNRFASGGPDRSVMVWDVSSGQILRRFNAHTGRINDVRFDGARNDGSVLWAAGSDTTLRAYDLRAAGAWRPIWEVHDASDAILCLATTPGRVHTASVDSQLRTYDLRMGELRTDTMDDPITSISPTHDGSVLLVSTLSSTHRMIDMADGTQLQSFRGHTQTSFRCHSTLSRDESLVLGGDESGTLWAWDTLTGRKKWAVKPDYRGSLRYKRTPGSAVTMLWTEVAPEEGSTDMATASSCGTVHLWAAQGQKS